MSFDDVHAWARILGEPYTTEDKSHFFYSLLKMQKPDRVLELGVGMGVTSFFMAQALAENGRGHLYAVDDGSGWTEFQGWLVDQLKPHPRFAEALAEATARAGASGREAFFPVMRRLAETLGGFADRITFLDARMGIEDIGPLAADEESALSAALAGPLDLVFSDIGHNPVNCLAILKKVLPFMAESSSLFLDSASTLMTSHGVLEQTVAQLNHGKLPAFLLAQLDEPARRRMSDLVAARRFTLMHLTERKHHRGNSMAWIKIEPVDVFPHPIAGMRGLLPDVEKILSADAIDGFYKG
jgi:hypothetical protein